MITSHSTNSIPLEVDTPKGGIKYIVIEPVLMSDDNETWQPTGIFNILKDSFYNNSSLAFASLDLQDEYLDVPNDKGPDYLGRILFDIDKNWIYDGEILTIDEQEQVGEFIKTHKSYIIFKSNLL